MNYFTLTQDGDGVAIVTMDNPAASSNTMSDAYKDELDAVLDQLEAQRDTLAGVVITSTKRDFLAGGDLPAMRARVRAGTPAVFADAQRVKQQLRRLETLGRPVVAALNGSALGGGLELALACHARICVDSHAVKLGFPEVTLGLMPGSGGVVRSVRMLGLLKAVPLLADGTLLSPRAAQGLGLVDVLVATADDLLAAAREWIGKSPAATQPWDVKSHVVPGGALYDGTLYLQLSGLTAGYAKKTRGLLPAPGAIVACAAESSMLPFELALKIESDYFTQLAVSRVAGNLAALNFFDRRTIRRGAARPAKPASEPVKQVGVLGAGMMGSGIAWSLALAGIAVELKDVDLPAAERGRARIVKLADKEVAAGRMTAADAQALLALVRAADLSTPFGACDFLIEAVFEDPVTKRLAIELHEHPLPDTSVFATNTSTLPVTGLAEAAAFPERIIGLHFFSPVDRMQLVEIIRGAQTSDATVTRAFDLVLAIGKTPIVVNDSRGFFASRVFQKLIYEGAAMVGEGIAPALVERAALQAGYPVGPLALLDETTLTLSKAVIAQTRSGLRAEGKYLAEHPGEDVIVRMVDEFGRAGRSTGGGFYVYDEDGSKQLWPGLANAFGHAATQPAIEVLVERFLCAQAVDAAACLEEGVLTSTAEANVGSVLGIGFPQWTGGVLRYIDMVGVRNFVERADLLRQSHGDRYAVPALLRHLADRGETVCADVDH